MYFVILTSVLLATAFAAPVLDESQAKVLAFENTNDEKGNYAFRYETSNNIIRDETGTLVNVGQPDEHFVVKGFYTYVKPDGEIELVHYIADEQGFRITSAPNAVYGLPAPLVASLLG